MFLFNDVIILCSKKDSAEMYDVQQVLYFSLLLIAFI